MEYFCVYAVKERARWCEGYERRIQPGEKFERQEMFKYAQVAKGKEQKGGKAGESRKEWSEIILVL